MKNFLVKNYKTGTTVDLNPLKGVLTVVKKDLLLSSGIWQNPDIVSILENYLSPESGPVILCWIGSW